MRVAVLASLVVLAAAPALAQEAQATEPPARVHVLCFLPDARRDQAAAALRIELAGHGGAHIVIEPLAALAPESPGTAERARAAGERAAASHVVWLEPGRVRVLALAQSAPAHAPLPEPYEVVDLRVVAVIAVSLLDEIVVVPVTAPTVEPAPEPIVTAPVEAPAPILVEAPVDEPPLGAYVAPPTGPWRPPRRLFRLAIEPEVGALWSREVDFFRGGSAERAHASFGGALSFYGRATDWLWIGGRFRIAGAMVSALSPFPFEGPIFLLALAPSVRAAFREVLGRDVTLDAGAHLDVGFLVAAPSSDIASNSPVLDLAIGVDATLLFVEQNAIGIDVSLSLAGIGASQQQFFFPAFVVWPTVRLFYAVHFAT